MEEYQLIEIIEAMFPEMEKLKFDGSGSINLINREIAKVGICVDVTDNVRHEAVKQGLDYLIVHHGNGIDEKLLSSARNIGAYKLHLPLDTAKGGLIDSLASIFNFDSIEDIALEYKGNLVEKGAVIGTLGFPRTSNYLRYTLEQASLKIKDKYFPNLSYVEVGPEYITEYPGYKSAITQEFKEVEQFQKIIVSTGPAIRTEFLGQITKFGANAFVAGSIKPDSKDYAKSKGLNLIAVGDYESHKIGMEVFVSKLNYKINSLGANAIFIPN